MKQTTSWCYTALAASWLVFSGGVSAAELPAGVKLAKNQEFIRNINTEPASIDPQKVEENAGSEVVNDLFEGLFSQGANGELRLAGATAYSVNPEGTVYTFTLRKEARWSDGVPVTAADYVYGWQRAADPATASVYSFFIELTGVKNAAAVIAGKMKPDQLGIVALDDHRLQITLDHPKPYLLKMLAHYTTFPAPRHVVSKYGEEWVKVGHIVGNGAYKLVEWTPNERLVAERNPRYWDDAHTVINKVSFLEVGSDAAAFNRYRANELDYTSYPLEVRQKVRNDMPEQLVEKPLLATAYYVFNTTKAPFNDARVRRALALGFDREIITNKVLGQGQQPAYSLTPPITEGFGFQSNALMQMSQSQRVEEAGKLLAAAGYSRDNPLRFRLVFNTNEGNKTIAVAISAMWQHNLPVKVDIQNMEWKTMLSTVHGGNFDVARYSWTGDYNEASTFLDQLSGSNSSNDSGWKNAGYDALLKQAYATRDDGARNALYRQAEAILEQEMPVMPIYFYVQSRLLKPDVKGFPLGNPEDKVYSKDLYRVAP